jgi:hypothetical protein
MKRSLIVAVICMIMLCVLVSWSWAEGETTSQPAATSTEKAAAGPVKPSLTWGDYKYTFYAVEPSSDIDPQSVIMNWEIPSPYNISWDGANYLHFWIHIEWPENLRPWDYMPLQLIVHTPGAAYHQFGKDCSNSSFLWRRQARYPSIVGNSTDVIFTMDTQGAPIDPNTGYLTVNGVLEVWDWTMFSLDNWVIGEAEDYLYTVWQRDGSTFNSITHLADIPLWEIIYGTPQ